MSSSTARTALLAGGLTLVAVISALVAAAVTGATAPLVLGDPGRAVRLGIPVLKVIVDLSAALTVGALVMAAVALPVTSARKQRGTPLAHPPALVLAAAASGVWALATLGLAVLTYADVAGIPLDDPAYGEQLGAFLTQVDLGIAMVVTLTLTAVISLLAAGARSLRSAGLLSLLALVALIPAALSGHSGAAADHETAVTALGLHIDGVAVWFGGLAALVLLRRGLIARHGDAVLVSAATRFSTLAVVSFAAVALSGVISSWLRVGDAQGLGTAYGALVVAKSLALVALGAAGWWHRRSTLAAMRAGRPGAFWRLVLAEVFVLAVASGIAVALARSAPPVPQVAPPNPTLAETVSGYPMPPPQTLSRWFTLWQPDLLWVLIAGLGIGLYLFGVVRLRRRGDAWPVGRTITWLVGVALLAWVTSGGPMVYGRVLFSAHMTGHMITTMAVPLFLVLGAPITLALRALRPRADGTRGAREWLLAVVESPFARVAANPAVAGTLFAGTLFAFYFSSLLPLALTTHVGHELMHLHFLASGYLFLWVLIGVDPGPRRPAPPLRMLTMFMTVAVHAFFGVTLMMSTRVLASDYFGGLGRTWGPDLLTDQRTGGGIAWGFGELPMLAVGLILAVQWARSDARESRRFDRAEARDGDSQLAAYNAMLAGLAERNAVRSRGSDRARGPSTESVGEGLVDGDR